MAAADAFQAALESTFARGQGAWPDVTLTLATWSAAVSTRLPEGAEATEVLALHAEDLYLAVACGAGDHAALQHLERRYLPALPGVLARLGLSASLVDETLQVLRDELFVARPGKKPGIEGYGGRGGLVGWLRAVASRTGLRLRPDPQRSAPVDEALAGEAGDLELEYLKRQYGPAFQESFREALAAMPAKSRLLLKQRFRHALSLEDLAALHGVHESTVSRWVTSAREELVAGTRDGMMRRLQIGRGDVSSILRLIESRVEITLSSVELQG